MVGFRATDNKGFHITFENGVTVSVQFGGGNYCDNHANFELLGHETEQRSVKSSNAELAIWDINERWITKEFWDKGDNVLGWLSPSEVLDALIWASHRS